MSNKVAFSVSWLPPKKDGANSMWGKPSERERIKSLRLAAYQAMQGQPLAESWVHMAVRIYAEPADGDLDNFITGICDSLMAAHPRTPINDMDWNDVDPNVKPIYPIIYKDDALVNQISAERLSPNDKGRHYEVVLEYG